jgi:hypothetical protein
MDALKNLWEGLKNLGIYAYQQLSAAKESVKQKIRNCTDRAKKKARAAYQKVRGFVKDLLSSSPATKIAAGVGIVIEASHCVEGYKFVKGAVIPKFKVVAAAIHTTVNAGWTWLFGAPFTAAQAALAYAGIMCGVVMASLLFLYFLGAFSVVIRS